MQVTTRTPNTTKTGRRFSETTVNAVWRKGRPVAGHDPSRIRKDACGAFIARSDYGRLTDMGWEIDHIVPVAQGGTEHIDNLQPLQWKNNRHKGDNWPNWTCAVTSKT